MFTDGAEPRRYSTWLADAVWAVQLVHPETAFVRELLPHLLENHRRWEAEHFVPEVGLFAQTGHDDGMEININSRQTRDTVRGAPGFRPTLNSYLWADERAIARMARLTGDAATADAFEAKAAALKEPPAGPALGRPAQVSSCTSPSTTRSAMAIESRRSRARTRRGNMPAATAAVSSSALCPGSSTCPIRGMKRPGAASWIRTASLRLSDQRRWSEATRSS
jgi:hypothetical protein